MNICLVEKRSKPPFVWRYAEDRGPKTPPAKGRIVVWGTFHGTKAEAKEWIRGRLVDMDRGEHIEPTKLTVGSWLESWRKSSVEPRLSSNTNATYESAIRNHLLPSTLGSIRLQRLRPTDVEAYHREKVGLSPATRGIHHAILSSALRLAVRDGLVKVNVATQAIERPRVGQKEEALNAWTAEEACAVIVAAKESGTQIGAFVALALDSGLRKGELQGLRWAAVDLTSGVLRVERQLLGRGKGVDGAPIFGPTKTRKVRALDLCAETLVLLREHKRQQAELKLANRRQYVDHGLVFARGHEHMLNRQASLGAPLSSSIVAGMLDRLVEAVGVRRITVHGLRHTSATLLLAAGVQPHVVQQRLGHSKIGTTLNTYAHVLPSMQQDAASRLAGLLYR